MTSNSVTRASAVAWSCQCSTRSPTKPSAERRAGELKPLRASAPATAMSLSASTLGTPGRG
eukprot:1698776-Lingulodinium_polyedra.AAC.1